MCCSTIRPFLLMKPCLDASAWAEDDLRSSRVEGEEKGPDVLAELKVVGVGAEADG